MRGFVMYFGTMLLLIAEPAISQTNSQAEAKDPVCTMIEAAARANALPVGSFVRLIWRESRFNPDAVGPQTRSGEHAQGIAQFMPGTAAERNLRKPFDPAPALTKSGEFLAELRDRFGNFGLAAAAYNAGPRRASEFIAGSRDLPLETKQYVLAITGRPITDWARLGKLKADEGDPADPTPGMTCRDLVDHQSQSSKSQLQQRAVPSWCLHLHHPNPNVCGAVHEAGVPRVSSNVRLGANAPKALDKLTVQD